MSCNVHSRMGPALHIARPPWLIFLFLVAVFFLVDHDLSNSKKGIGNFNLSEDEITTGVAEGSLIRRISLLSLGLFAIVSLIRHRSDGRLQIHGPLGWILLSFAAWALVSPIWAEDIPLTLTRVAVFGILCIAAVAVACRFSPREIILWTLFTAGLYLLIGVSAEVASGTFLPFTSGYRFAGTLPPNSQGTNCALLILSGVAAADIEKNKRRIFQACALVGFVFLILTASRTAFGATVFAIAVYFAASWSRSAKIAMAYVLSILFCLFLLVLVNASLPGLKSAVMLERDDSGVDSFNGRTGIWDDVSSYVRQRPILGYGYGGFWTPAHISEVSGEEKWAVPDSHSAYLDYFLSLGAVGLFAYLLLLCAGIRRAFRFNRLSHNSAFAFFGAFLVFCALNGLLESGVVNPSLPMFLSTAVLAQLAFVRPALSCGANGRIA
jgi:exopolysaccharide production protein ExoQ